MEWQSNVGDRGYDSLAPKVMKVVGVTASQFDNKGDIKDGGSDRDNKCELITCLKMVT